jgi:hypothetical protein
MKYNSKGKTIYFLTEDWEKGELYKSERQSFNYDENDNFILGTCEELDSGKWVHADGFFPFKDSRNTYFGGYGYKVEVSYKKITPVKGSIFDVNLQLTCSPNPTAGQLNINYNLSELAITSISISNISGIEVANISNNQMQLPGSYSTSYDTSKLTPGTYFITLIAGCKRVTSKFIINY